ncbi:MAG: hypothetical protein CSA62_06490 [Planctomycetota bacterium]|nr:MAG: hypothetical protein CSA62_06490 [Planctomycetota bacterium]
MHFYVDPIYGDDTLASQQNPDPSIQARMPLMQHPTLSQTAMRGLLQHAPYSWRTVTAALGFIRAKFLPAQQGRYLPWHNSNTHASVKYIVIHCLPGLYGPKKTSQEHDPVSGLPWNGEAFPLNIPQRVSIQGASALDTIFDARSKEAGIANTSIFHIGYPQPEHHHEFEYTFIDSVTIRGARGGGNSRAGAGVLIDLETPVKASITNCFITDNSVGIGIWKDAEDYEHYPIIANNTIVWNQIGLWNGSSVSIPSRGESKLRVFNNIFDSSTPQAMVSNFNTIIGVSCFEGLDQTDRTVNSVNGNWVGRDVNAYEYSTNLMRRVNLGDTLSAPPTAWPRTLSRTPTQSYLGTDISAYTQPSSSYQKASDGRKCLYITDVFRHYISSVWLKVSAHDFRLAPMAENINGMLKNPLINLGVDFGVTVTGTAQNIRVTPRHSGMMIFGNSLSLTHSPGLPPSGVNGPEDKAELNAWDWDADGHGNPRIVDRRYALTHPLPGSDFRIDLGADESGELTIAGYLTSTRIFTRAHPWVASHTAQFPATANLWFFNFFHGSGSTQNIYPRPWFNFCADILFNIPFPRLQGNRGSEWFNQALVNPYDSSGTSNYTNGRYEKRSVPALYNLREWFVASPPTGGLVRPPLPKFMRNLCCDIAPHLVHDVQPEQSNHPAWYPWWGERFDFVRPTASPFPQFRCHPGVFDDIFKSNPWFENPIGSPDAKYSDNRFLYYDSSQSNTWIRSGHINPPLTLPQDALVLSTESYLFTNTRHPLLVYNYGSVLDFYNVGVNGFDPVPDAVPYYPGSGWHGVRINCELILPDYHEYWSNAGVFDNNLQSFLAVDGGPGATVESYFGENQSASRNLGVKGKARQRAMKFLQALELRQNKSRK